jgi:hypothetical protein
MHKHIINASPESATNTIVTIGIDLAKNVFAIHGVNCVWQTNFGVLWREQFRMLCRCLYFY